jgi:hypothetical protein
MEACVNNVGMVEWWMRGRNIENGTNQYPHAKHKRSTLKIGPSRMNESDLHLLLKRVHWSVCLSRVLDLNK